MENTQQLNNTQALFYKENDQYFLLDGSTKETIEVPYRIDNKGYHCFKLPKNCANRTWLMVSEFNKKSTNNQLILDYKAPRTLKTKEQKIQELEEMLAKLKESEAK